MMHILFWIVFFVTAIGAGIFTAERKPPKPRLTVVHDENDDPEPPDDLLSPAELKALGRWFSRSS